ncbi:MAG: damage-inducible protein CinA [Rhizobiales bacterium 65-9]|nr:CinA family protein [Hyphomicrobiales bacterium]OJY35668.1 MAG: damage-inducible protein CinA [Rhizobiales bacterium 65-9]
MIDPIAVELARQALELAREKGLMIATAESCTGGLVAMLLTETAGASDVFERGFVTYSNRAKQETLGVPFDLIERHGAVSEEVARAMAEGALMRSAAQVAVAITGVAGPGGGTDAKPVGLVHIAARKFDGAALHREFRFGHKSRSDIRSDSARAALSMLNDLMGGSAFA